MVDTELMSWWMIFPLALAAVVFGIAIYGLIRLIRRWSRQKNKDREDHSL